MGQPPLSIRIEPTRLSESLVGREFVYLVTSGGERAHVVALRCTVVGDRVTMTGTGRSARSNIDTNPRVSLVWPPTTDAVEFREYTVVADGSATFHGDDVEITVSTAVFHRPAP